MRRVLNRSRAGVSVAVLALAGCAALGWVWHSDGAGLRPLAAGHVLEPHSVEVDPDLLSIALTNFERAEPAHFAEILHRVRYDAALAAGAGRPGLRDVVFSAVAFRKRFGRSPYPVQPRDGTRWAVRPPDGPPGPHSQTELHLDQLIATCAECDAPIDQPFEPGGGRVTVGDLVASAQYYYVPDQDSEWSAVAFAHYCRGRPEWTNRFGDRVTLGGVIETLIGRPADVGPCGGTHRCYALAAAARADAAEPCLTRETRRRVGAALTDAAGRLAATQTPAGGWAIGWADPTVAPDPHPDLTQMIAVTGHHLEWATLATGRSFLPRESVERAARFLVAALARADVATIQARYCEYSHAARALRLLCRPPKADPR